MRNYSGGYIGILLIFIGTVIVIFLAVQQYEHIGLRMQNKAEQQGVGATDSSKILSPLDRALDAKATLEVRDRTMLDQ